MARRSKNAFLEGLGAGFGQSFAKAAAYDPDAKLRKESALLEYRDNLLKMGYTVEEADQAIDQMRKGKAPQLPTARPRYLQTADLQEGQPQFLDGGERISTLDPVELNTDALYVRDEQGRLVRQGSIPRNRAIEDPFMNLNVVDPQTGNIQTTRVPKGQVRTKPRPAGGPQETPEEKAQRMLNVNTVKLYQKRIDAGELLTDEDVLRAQTAAEALGGRFEESEIEKDGFFGKKKAPLQQFIFDDDQRRVMGIDLEGGGQSVPTQKKGALKPAPKERIATKEIFLKAAAAIKAELAKSGRDVSSPDAIRKIKEETARRLKQAGYTGL